MRFSAFALIVMLGLNACSPQAQGGETHPEVFSQIYRLEIPTTGESAIFIVHQPLAPNTKDSIWTNSGGWYECKPLHRHGVTSCGKFEFREANDGIIATFQQCRSTSVPGWRTVTDFTTGESYRESTRVTRTECSTVPVILARVNSRADLP